MIVCFAAALAALLFATPAYAEDPAFVLTPAHEPFFADTLGGELGGCRAEAISIERDHVSARFLCGADPAVLRLDPPSRDRPAAARTRKFTLVTQGPAPAPLVEALRARLLAREEAFTWATLASPPPPDTLAQRALRPAGIRFASGLIAALALVGGTIITGLALLFAGRRRAPEAPASRPPLSPLAALVSASFLLVAALVAARFRFFEDDFFQLLRALDHPWEMDDSLRLISGALFYGAGVRLGPAWFIAVNLLVWLGSAALLHALFRRAGHSRDEALIAASIACLAPGYFPLVRSATGFQTSASIALGYGVLLLVDAAARTRLDERARRAGHLAIALALTGLGVFIKYPMMAVVPILAWIWGKHVVRDAPPPLSRHPFYAAFAVAVAVPLALTHVVGQRTGELDKAGIAALLANLGNARRWLAPTLFDILFALAVLYIGQALLGGRARAVDALRDDRLALAQRRPWILALLAAVTLAPFLFNARYFAAYYVVPCTAWIAALAAIPLAAASRRLPGRAGVVVALLATAALLPLDDIRGTRSASVANDPTPLLDAARRATKGRPAPCGLRLEAACATPEATAASAADLRALANVTEDKQGLRWATGWHEIDVAGPEPRGTLAATCAAPLTLRYCAGRGMWIDDTEPR